MNDARPPLSVRAALRTALAPLLLSFGAGATCYFVLGVTTGFFFGAVALVGLLTPPLVVAHADRARQLVAAAAVADGVAAACLFAVADPAVSLLDWLKVYVLLAAFGAAAWGVADAASRSAGMAPVLASALTVALALAWLAWPVWLSPWLAGREELVASLVKRHPLFAVDAALRHLGPAWTERHYMYTRLTVLNQDVFYSLPGGVTSAVALHAGFAAGCLLPFRRLWQLLRGRLGRHGRVPTENDRREHLR